MSHPDRLIACPECDLLQYEPRMPPRGAAYCPRCEARLAVSHPQALEHALAYNLAAAACLVVANAFPVALIFFQGESSATTLWFAVRHLYGAGMPFISTLVALTAIVIPVARVLLAGGILGALRLNAVPPLAGPALALLRQLRRWSMVDVLVLGLLVSLVKLRGIITLHAGMGLWATIALMLALSAEAGVFDTRAVWARIAVLRAARGATRSAAGAAP